MLSDVPNKLLDTEIRVLRLPLLNRRGTGQRDELDLDALAGAANPSNPWLQACLGGAKLP